MPFSFISPNLLFNFIAVRRYAYGVSLLLLLLGIFGIVYNKGIPLGVDFQGGSLVQLQFKNPVSTQEVRNAFEGAKLTDISVQSIGETSSEYLIRFSQPTNAITSIQDTITTLLQKAFPATSYSIERMESVGAKVSSDTRDSALEALYYAILIIAIYISGRFEGRWFAPIMLAGILSIVFLIFTKLSISILYLVPIVLVITIIIFIKLHFPFALGAILSLIHDVLITSGLLIFFGISFDLSIIAALLAIIGYSLNDTIIVYDRIRELLREQKPGSYALEDILNKSISSTLSRTVLTSLTTLFVLIALLIFGGTILFPFALTLFIGIFIGTLSSIFIASPVLLFFGVENFTVEKKTITIDENGVV